MKQTLYKIKDYITSIKLDWKIITIAILTIIILFMTRGCGEKETIEVEVPVKIEVPVPVVEKYFDTIDNPVPYRVINPVNTELQRKYDQATDSIKKLLFNKVIAEKEYNEKYEDTFQTINVYSKIKEGMLSKQTVNYKTKPYSIKVDTVINTVIQTPKVNKKFFMVEGGNNFKELSPKVKASVLFINKKDRIINVGYERDFISNQDYGWVGYGFRF